MTCNWEFTEMNQHEQQPQAQSMGKIMTILAWVCGLALLTMVFSDALERQINPNPDPRSELTRSGMQVSLQQNRMGHYVAGGLINGQRVTFLVDTGATDVSVPAHLANYLGLAAGRSIPVSTANGVIRVAETSIQALEIGGIRLSDVDANLNPGMTGDKILLGMSALKQLEFTQRGDQLILRTL